MRKPAEINETNHATQTSISAIAYKRDLGFESFQTEYIVYDLNHNIVIDQFSIAYNNPRKIGWFDYMTSKLGKNILPATLASYKPVYGKRDVEMIQQRLKWISYSYWQVATAVLQKAA